MNIIKKSIWILLIPMVFALTGCDLLGQSDEKLFQDVVDNMNDMYNFEMSMTIDLEVDGQDMSSQMDFDVDMESETKGLMKMQMEMMGMIIDAYIDMQEDEVTMYMKIPILNQWTKETMTMEEFTQSEEDTDTDDYLFVLENYVSYEFIEDTTIDGVDVKKFEFVLDESSILDDMFGEEIDIVNELLGIINADEKDYFSDVKYQIYIDVENKVIRKIEVDLSSSFEQLIDDIKEDQNSFTFDITKAYYSIEISNIGNVNVTIPDSVKENAVTDPGYGF